MIPAGYVPAPINHYVNSPVSEGFVNGYLTMDTLGALVFGIVIIQAIYSRGVTDNKLVTKYAIIMPYFWCRTYFSLLAYLN